AVCRQSLSIASRAVAVAEAGSDLNWSTNRDRVRVEQRKGAVFYRVDHGSPFVVSTGVADVIVTGTCFQVEVEPPIDNRAADLLNAVVVRVFEGSVRVTNQVGAVPVVAGERVRVEPGHAPGRVTAVALTETLATAPDAAIRQ